jgi:hypothetical protein
MYTPNELAMACYAVGAATALAFIPAACSNNVCLWALENPHVYDMPSAPQLQSLSSAGRTLLPVAISSAATVAVLRARARTSVWPAASPIAIVASQVALVVATVVAGLSIGSHVSVVDPIAGAAFNATPLFASLAITCNAAAVVWVHLSRHNTTRIKHNAQAARKQQ